VLGLQAGHYHGLQKYTCLDAEDVETDGGCRGNQQFAIFCQVDRTTGLLNLEDADALTLLCGEHADGAVIGAREK